MVYGSYATAVFAVLTIGIIFFGWFDGFDRALLNYAGTVRSATLTNFFLFFTGLAEWQTIAGLALVWAILFGKRRPMLVTYMLFGLIFSEACVFVLKIVIHRPRPVVVPWLVNESSYALPSGHTAMSFVFFGMAVYVFARTIKNDLWRRVLLVLTSVVVFFIGISRIYLGVHWPTDVLSSWILGSAFLAIWIAVGRSSGIIDSKKNE